MTTIVIARNQIACDSGEIGIYSDKVAISKVRRYRDKGWLGFCGNCSDIELAFGYAEEYGLKFPDSENLSFLSSMKDEPDGLLLMDSGEAYWLGAHLVPMPTRVPAAIGSGARFAMGALLAGADIRKAVEIACELDSQSSGPVQVYNNSLEYPRASLSELNIG